jgi:hypothetical protein
MGRFLKIYFNAVFGGLGGLLGWMLFSEQIRPETSTLGQNEFLLFGLVRLGNAYWWLTAGMGGVLIGGSIGYFVASVDAILDRALLRFIRYAFVGVLLGGFGGMLGMLVGEYLNLAFQRILSQQASWGVVVPRALGWMVFGLLVGMSEGVAARSMNKISYGAIGGALGGVIGGALFGLVLFVTGAQAPVAPSSDAKQTEQSAYVFGPALGLVILGACIGMLRALVEEVLKPAALKVLRGWQEGREYPIVKPETFVGRDEAVDILLLRDMKVEKRHVSIQRMGDRFVLINHQAPAAQTLVNEQPIVHSCELRDGDRIQLGNVVLVFLERAARERVRRSRPQM